MKLNGKKIEHPNVEIVVLPRGDGDDLVFKARAVLDTSDFDKLCPPPEPPKIMRKGGITVLNTEDRGYRQELQNHGKLKISWMILQSLRATETLEWETVKYDDPNTWNDYQKELSDAGLAEMEVARIVSAVMIANALNEDKVNEARERFLAGEQAARLARSSHEAALNGSPSGEPASGSV